MCSHPEVPGGRPNSALQDFQRGAQGEHLATTSGNRTPQADAIALRGQIVSASEEAFSSTFCANERPSPRTAGPTPSKLIRKSIPETAACKTTLLRSNFQGLG